MKHAVRPPRIFLFQRKRWSAALCLCLAALMFYFANYPAAVGASATTRQLPIYCVQRDQKLVSISFDAAWGNVRMRPSVPVKHIIQGPPQNLKILRRPLFSSLFPYSRTSLMAWLAAIKIGSYTGATGGA